MASNALILFYTKRTRILSDSTIEIGKLEVKLTKNKIVFMDTRIVFVDTVGSDRNFSFQGRKLEDKRNKLNINIK